MLTFIRRRKNDFCRISSNNSYSISLSLSFNSIFDRQAQPLWFLTHAQQQGTKKRVATQTHSSQSLIIVSLHTEEEARQGRRREGKSNQRRTRIILVCDQSSNPVHFLVPISILLFCFMCAQVIWVEYQISETHLVLTSRSYLSSQYLSWWKRIELQPSSVISLNTFLVLLFPLLNIILKFSIIKRNLSIIFEAYKIVKKIN